MSDDNARNKIEKYLSTMGKLNASDLHLKVYSPPIFRVNGTPRRLDGEPFTPETIESVIMAILTPEQKERLNREGGVDFAYSISGKGRFRINVYRQRNSISLCARMVNMDIPTIKGLHLPEVLNKITEYKNGIVLTVGATGSGKSSTLAGLLGTINSTRRCHILTIEDPIEYLYQDEKSFVNQREVGIDAPDFAQALKFALRQDPDVILVGEMRDADTIETAVAASETGHLVFSTLHANNSVQAISRLLDFFSADVQMQMRKTLGHTLRAVFAQKLLPCLDKEIVRVPAVEILLVNPLVKKLIVENRDNEIPQVLRDTTVDGMQDFNMSLYSLVKSGMISEDIAFDYSPNVEQLKMNLKGMRVN